MIRVKKYIFFKISVNLFKSFENPLCPRYEAASQQLVKKDSEMRERDGQLTEVTGQLALATLQNRDHQLSLGNVNNV